MASLILDKKLRHMDKAQSMSVDTMSEDYQPCNFSISTATNLESLEESTGIVNLFKPLAECDWDGLERLIKRLSFNVSLLLPSLTVTNSNDLSTPLHIISWKAPPSLSLELLRLIPREEESLFLARDAQGNTALHLCAANLQPSVNAFEHIQNQFDISALQELTLRSPRSVCVMQNSKGDTPLHLLVATPYPKPLLPFVAQDRSLFNAVSFLIKRNNSVCLVKDSSGATPLHVSVANSSSFDLLSAVLQGSKEAASVEDKYGMLPLHYVAAFLKTPVHSVSAIYEAYPSAVTQPTANGDVPLHLAISNASRTLYRKSQINRESLKIVQALIQTHTHEENSPLLIFNKEKLTPLHCCALFDTPPQLTKLLMKHPLGEKAACKVNSFGATPLHLAAAQPGIAVSVSSILALGTREAANIQDRLKRNALHVASQNIHSNGYLIKSLIELNPDAVKTCTSRGYLPLHLAAQSHAKEQVIKELIKAYPDGTSVQNINGNTPLHDACKSKSTIQVIKLLLEAYPDAVSIQNSYGNLPLHCAAAYQCSLDIVVLLLQQYPEACLIQNNKQETPLHYTVTHGNKKVLEVLIQIAPQSLAIKNASDQTPLEKALAHEGECKVSTDIISYLNTFH